MVARPAESFGAEGGAAGAAGSNEPRPSDKMLRELEQLAARPLPPPVGAMIELYTAIWCGSCHSRIGLSRRSCAGQCDQSGWRNLSSKHLCQNSSSMRAVRPQSMCGACVGARDTSL